MNLNGKIIKRIFLITAVGLAAVAIIVGFLSATTSYAKETIKIGVSLSLTGKYAWTANRMREGMDVWQKFINERGYTFGLEKYGHKEPGLIDGRPVQFIIYDDKSDPATAIKLYQKLLTVDKVDLCWGPYSSAIVKAVSPVLERAKMPTVTNAASDPGIWKGRNLKWVVQGLQSTDAYFPGAAEIAYKRGAKTAAIVFEDTAFPTGLARSFKNQLEKYGIKLVLFEAYPKGITDWTPILSKAWALKPDIIGIGGYEPDSIGITKAAQGIRATPKLFVWTVGTQSPHYVEAVGEACLAMTGETLWEPTLNTPGNKEYVKAFEQIIGTPANKQVYQQAFGCMGGQILEIAIKSVGSLEDLSAIRDKLFTMEVETIFGPYKVMPLESEDSGLQVGLTGLLIQWQKKKPGAKLSPDKCVVGDYVKEIIWPEKLKTADPIYPFPGWKR